MEPKANDTLSGKARDTFARVVEHIFTDECSLSATTRAYRWSVTGPNFHSLHKLFDEQRRQLDHWLSQLFQRTRAAGLAPDASIEALTRAPVRGADLPPLPASQMIDDLLARHEEMSRKLRENVTRLGDPATVDLLRRIADFHDTTAWMLRMLLERPETHSR